MLKKPNEEVLVQSPATIIAGEVKLSGKEVEDQLQLGHSCIMNIQADGILFSGINKANGSEDTGETTGDYYWVLSVMYPTVDEPGHWTKTWSKKERLRWAKEKVSVQNEKLRVTVDKTEVGGLEAYSVSRVFVSLLGHGADEVVVLVGNRDQRVTSSQQGGAYRRCGTRYDAEYLQPQGSSTCRFISEYRWYFRQIAEREGFKPLPVSFSSPKFLLERTTAIFPI